MSRYLDKFRSTMPSNQARHVLEFLTELKDQGSIRTVGEYNSRLQDLIGDIEMDSPQFQQFLAFVRDVIDSDRYNAMVRAVRIDLETAFKEAENASDILELHKQLHKLTILENLQTSIGELDRKISMYEYLARDSNGWTSGQTNTFNHLGGTTPRSSNLAGTLYRDPRTPNSSIDSDEDAGIDLAGQRLVLPVYSNEEINLAGVEILHDAETTEPARDLQEPELNLGNIIDQRYDTFWAYPVLLDTFQRNVRMKIRLDLGGTRVINALRIDPATSYPLVLESITYLGTDNDTNVIEVETLLERSKRIYISDVTTNALTLTFRQDNGAPVAYYHKPELNLWNLAVRFDLDPEIPDNSFIDRNVEDLENLLPDDELREYCDIPAQPGWTLVRGVQYDFSIDNIRVYSDDYKTRGIFIGEKMHVERPGLIGIKTKETKPDIRIGNTDYQPYSFEYNVYKQNYDEEGRLLDSEMIPLLPLTADGEITGERLWLVGRSGASVNNLAELRFIPDISAGSPVVKRNVIETLSIGADFSVRVSRTGTYRNTWSEVATDIAAAANDELPVYLKLLSPSAQAFYSIDYTALMGRKIRTHVRMQKDGTFLCNYERSEDVSVDSADLYFITILRRNYISERQTNALEEYKLLVASYDTAKFGSE